MDETQPYRRAVPQARRAQRLRVSRRRRPNWGRRIKIILLLLLIAVIAGGAFLAQRAVAFNAAVSTEPPFTMRLFGPFAPERVNVLLLGYSDESREGAFLSDSMNILSIDRATDTTSLIAIPRDLWIEGLPQVPQNMKVNEALRIGYYAAGLENGAELAAEAVTHATGLQIHGWITLDFHGFAAMVDAVGGVTVENPTAFSYAWDEGLWLMGEWDGHFEAGTLHLDGEHALTYARNRYTSVPAESSDFARLVRQQRVLEAIRAKLGGAQLIPRGLAVAGALEGHMRTSTPVLDLLLLGTRLGVDRRVELSEDVILQAATNSAGQYVLVVIGRAHAADYTPLHEYITDQLAAPLPTPSEEPSVAP